MARADFLDRLLDRARVSSAVVVAFLERDQLDRRGGLFERLARLDELGLPGQAARDDRGPVGSKPGGRRVPLDNSEGAVALERSVGA